jgi:hypothetical protein
MKKALFALLALVLLSPARLCWAQTPAAAAAAQPLVPLQVRLVLSRYEGEKKTGSLPYTLTVVANAHPGRTSVRMGVSVPIRGLREVVEGKDAPSVQYRSVGTDIDCDAGTAGPGLYRLELTVEQTAVSPPAEKALPDEARSALPLFRNFRSRAILLLRDGQTMQYAAAADPISGETARIDVSLSVLK